MVYAALPAGALPPAAGRRLTDAQVLTTAWVAARFWGGNLVVAKHCRQQHFEHNQLGNTYLIRRLHPLTDTRLSLFATVSDLLTHLHTEARYVLDSLPVAGYPKMLPKYPNLRSSS